MTLSGPPTVSSVKIGNSGESCRKGESSLTSRSMLRFDAYHILPIAVVLSRRCSKSFLPYLIPNCDIWRYFRSVWCRHDCRVEIPCYLHININRSLLEEYSTFNNSVVYLLSDVQRWEERRLPRELRIKNPCQLLEPLRSKVKLNFFKSILNLFESI